MDQVLVVSDQGFNREVAEKTEAAKVLTPGQDGAQQAAPLPLIVGAERLVK